MSRNHLVILAIVSLSAVPAVANLVDVSSVDGTVSGSGVAAARNDFDPSGFNSESFSFTGTNTQLGTFSMSGQASASGAPIWGDFITVTGLTQQTTTSSTRGIAVDFLTSATVDGFGTQWFAEGQLSNQYTLAFTLDAPSLMHVMTTGRESYGYGYTWWNLTGPFPGGSVDGFDFGSFDETFMVDPGTYFLSISDLMNFRLYPVSRDQIDSLSVSADFTAIPEPHWTTMVPPLLVFIGIGYRSRKRYTFAERLKNKKFCPHVATGPTQSEPLTKPTLGWVWGR